MWVIRVGLYGIEVLCLGICGIGLCGSILLRLCVVCLWFLEGHWLCNGWVRVWVGGM